MLSRLDKRIDAVRAGVGLLLRLLLRKQLLPDIRGLQVRLTSMTMPATRSTTILGGLLRAELAEHVRQKGALLIHGALRFNDSSLSGDHIKTSF